MKRGAFLLGYSPKDRFASTSFALASFALAALLSPLGHGPALAAGSCELRPVLIENFNEDTAPNRRIESISPKRIGPARWTAHTPWNGDFGDAAFQDPGPNGPFQIKDGMLSITASRDSMGRWTSGL